MTTTIIQGFASTDKVPGGYGEVVYGAGAISASSVPLELLLVGMMTTGTATPDVSIVDIASADAANAAFGQRSQIARMCRIALLTPGVTIKAMAVTPASGGTAAQLTITVSSTWTAGGQYNFRLGGEGYSVGIAASDVLGDVANKIRDAINANANGFATATASGGVVTVLVSIVGAYGNDYIAFQDTTACPAGCTIALGGGGAAVTGGGLHFASGAGTENITAALTALYPTFYARIGSAQNDTTNLAKWITQINNQAGVIEGRRQHFVAATTAASGTATSLANTTINNARFELLWQLNGESHPSEAAADFAAIRTAAEQGDPDAAYDGAPMHIVPNQQSADWPQHATLVTALNNGVTPIQSSKTQAFICRAIVTKCLTGTNPDYRVLDTGDAVVPDYVLFDLLLLWSTSFKIENPHVRDNYAPEEGETPAGVATPEIWNRVVFAKLRSYERGDGFQTGIIVNVTAHPPTSNYDAVAKRIMSVVPVVAAPNQHQIGLSVRQLAA